MVGGLCASSSGNRGTGHATPLFSGVRLVALVKRFPMLYKLVDTAACPADAGVATTTDCKE